LQKHRKLRCFPFCFKQLVEGGMIQQLEPILQSQAMAIVSCRS
jgi:hypothetical protein